MEQTKGEYMITAFFFCVNCPVKYDMCGFVAGITYNLYMCYTVQCVKNVYFGVFKMFLVFSKNAEAFQVTVKY